MNSRGVMVTTGNADYGAQLPDRGLVPIEELARRHGVRPIQAMEDMARPDIFDSILIVMPPASITS